MNDGPQGEGGREAGPPFSDDDIRNREPVETWLRGRPREDAIVLAARAALRVLPLINPRTAGKVDNWRAIILCQCWRATAAPWQAGTWLSQRGKIASGAVARTVVQTLDAASGEAFSPAYATAPAAIAFSAAVHAARAASSSETAIDAVNALYAAINAAPVAAARAANFSDAVAMSAADIGAATARFAFDADVAALERGEGATFLGLSPLWPERMPDWVSEWWSILKHHLLTDAADEGWEVWTDWYEARLKGERSETNPDGAGPVNMELEKARVLIPNEVWEDGPKAVNDEIRRLIEEHAPKSSDLPPERLTPVSFEFREGALRPVPPEPAEAATGREAYAAAAWQGIRELLDDQLETGGGRQHARLGSVLQRCSGALGDSFASLDLIRLGVHAARLQEYAAHADEILLPEDASDLVSLNAQIALFLGQFPEWTDYLRGLGDGFGSDRAEQRAVEDAAAALDGVGEAAPGIMSGEADAALGQLREDATPEHAPSVDGPLAPPLARRSYLRAARSALRALAARALDDVRSGASKGIQKTAEASTVAALASVKGYLMSLALGLPGEFAWLAGIATYFARVHVKSERGADAKTAPGSDNGSVGT